MDLSNISNRGRLQAIHLLVFWRSDSIEKFRKGMQHVYHRYVKGIPFSMRGIRKGYLFSQKWYMKGYEFGNWPGGVTSPGNFTYNTLTISQVTTSAKIRLHVRNHCLYNVKCLPHMFFAR